MVLGPGDSIELRFLPRNGEVPPPMVIHYDDAFRADRLDKELADTRTPDMFSELLAARKQ